MKRKGVFYLIWLATCILLIVPFFTVDSLRAWRITAEGQSSFFLWLYFGYFLSNALARVFYKLLGLSQKRQIVESIEVSCIQENSIVPEEKVIKIWKPQPLGSGAYVPATLFAVLGLIGLSTPLLSDKIAALMSFAMSSAWIYVARLGIDKPSLTVTASGITSFYDTGNLWSKYVKWEQVAKCDIVTDYDMWGAAKHYLSFKNVRGKQLLTASIKEATQEEQDQLIRFVQRTVKL